MTRRELSSMAVTEGSAADILAAQGWRSVVRCTARGECVETDGAPFAVWTRGYVLPDWTTAVLARLIIGRSGHACEIVTREGGAIAVLTDY